jgi:hypothetical protein
MLKPESKVISIATDLNQTTLSKGQKTFNNLIKKIEAKRTRLAAWQEVIPVYQNKRLSEFDPLIETAQTLQVELVHALDRACEQKKSLTVAERRKATDFISELSCSLADVRNDEQMKDIYNKYSGSNFDTEKSASMNELKFMFKEMTGIDLGDDIKDLSQEEFLKHAQERMRLHFTEEVETEQPELQTRKKTAGQLAKEAKQKTDEQEIGQSIREVYRKLVSALHPDRETDPQECERKTILMQRVNQAYDKKNLLLLLELQLELEHIDQATINNLTESKLKHFTKILKEQLTELEQEIFFTEELFKHKFDIAPYIRLSPDTVMRQLNTNIIDMNKTISDLKRDLFDFQDIKKIKVWLKNITARQASDLWDSPF